MARFSARRSSSRRRFGRRRRLPVVRRARRILKRVKRKQRKKSIRKKKKKQYFLGFSGASHNETAVGTIAITDPDASATNASGLFAYNDINEILQQLKTIEDLVYPAGGMYYGGIPHNRGSIKAYAKGVQNYIVSNGNQAGAVWLEIYICKPRKGIPEAGIGYSSLLRASDVINANRNQRFVTDYNDAQQFGINAAGTGGVTNIMQNAQSQTRPSVSEDAFYVTPYMIPAFTENWKVVKQLKYVLPPGGQCMFSVKAKGLLDRNQLRKGTGTGSAAADWNIHRPWFGKEVFFRFHGQPVHDITTHTSVNYGKATLDCVFTKKYWYYPINGQHIPSYVTGGQVNLGVIASAQLPSLPTEPVTED